VSTHKGEPAASIRTVIQQAMSAYELAVATRIRAEREAQELHHTRVAGLEAQELAASKDREQARRSQQAVAATKVQRIEVLATLADEVKKSAASLLEKAALAHVRGFSARSVDSVQAHTASDEQAAAAFTAAEVASVELRAALLKLAEAHLKSGHWKQARDVLIPLRDEATGHFANEVTALLHTAYLQEATSALDSGQWDQARQLTEEALQLAPGDEAPAQLLREISFRQALAYLQEATSALDSGQWDQARQLTEEALLLAPGDEAPAQLLREISFRQAQAAMDSGEPEKAWNQALTWLKDHDGHTEIQDLLFHATFQLADQALAADDCLGASRHISATAGQVGHDHPRIREWARRHPRIGWWFGDAVLLHEFAGHGQPVQDVAFTADGDFVVSLDANEAKTWSVAGADAGRLVQTVPMPRAHILAPGALLALSLGGVLRSTQNGEVAQYIRAGERTAPGAFTAAFSPDGTLVAWAGPFSLCGARMLESLTMSIQVYEIPTGRTLRLGLKDWRRLHGCALSADNRLVAILLCSDKSDWFAGNAVIIDVQSGITRQTLGAVRMPAFWPDLISAPIAFSPGSDLVVVAHAGAGSAKNRMTAWDTASGRSLWSWDARHGIGAFVFSPDGRLIVGLEADGNIRVFDVKSQQALPAIGTHGIADFPCLAFSPDGSRLATSGDRTVKVWGLL